MIIIIMKYRLMSIVFILIVMNGIRLSINCSETRLYSFRIIAFHVIYDVFCAMNSEGYFKYPYMLDDIEVFVTYETEIFLRKSEWDENFTVVNTPIPMNMWTTSTGETYRMIRRVTGPQQLINRKKR